MALTHCEPSMVEPPSRRPSSMDNSVPSLTIETDSRDENRRPATSVLILRRAEGRRTPMVYLFLCLCWNCTMTVVRRIESAYRSKPIRMRSEEHTSELQSLRHLVCRLLLEKKKT